MELTPILCLGCRKTLAMADERSIDKDLLSFCSEKCYRRWSIMPKCSSCGERTDDYIGFIETEDIICMACQREIP